MDKQQEQTIDQRDLETYTETTVRETSAELMRLANLVADSISIELINGQIMSNSKLTSSELEALAMLIPAECLRIQSSLNRYSSNNVFRDIAIDARITESIAEMLGTKGNADERKRRAELMVLDERTINAANKAIIKGLQASIDRADKVYEGIKKVMDFRAREGWFDRKGPN